MAEVGWRASRIVRRQPYQSRAKRMLNMAHAGLPRNPANSEDDELLGSDDEEAYCRPLPSDVSSVDSDLDSDPELSETLDVDLSLRENIQVSPPSPDLFADCDTSELTAANAAAALDSSDLFKDCAISEINSSSPLQLTTNMDNDKKLSSRTTRSSATKMRKSTPILKTVPKKGRRKKVGGHAYDFSSNVFSATVDVPEDNFSVPANILSDLEYFQKFFSADLLKLIVEGTNQYSVQETGRSVETNADEINDFLAIQLLFGIVKFPAYTDAWSGALRYEKIAEIMPLKRYETLRRYLHFVDNNHLNPDDPFAKIRPVAEIIRRNCTSLENERRQSVDEMMAPYKGKKAGKKKQYLKMKPKKWGIKIFVRAGISGIVYDFLLYGGASTFQDVVFTEREEDLGFGPKVVLALCQSIPEKPLTAVYFDNYFTSLDLLHHLRNEYGILGLGTIRKDRLRGCQMDCAKKAKRGTSCEKADDTKNVTIIKWIDRKEVILASNFVGRLPEATVKRFSKAEGKKVDIACPLIVKEYNRHMGGVDLTDMLIALYRTAFRTKRWYMVIFSQLLDVCVNNAWRLRQRESALTGEPYKTKLKMFRLSVAESLIKKFRAPKIRQKPSGTTLIRKPALPRPQEDIRFDGVEHFPKPVSQKGRCKNCRTGYSRIECVKCKMTLCLVQNRNCFYDFHHKK